MIFHGGRLEHLKSGNRFIEIKKSGNTVLQAQVDNRGIVTSSSTQEAIGKPIEDLIGKPMGQQVIAEPSGSIKGEQFTVGGKGMEGFYDQILPKSLNNLGKKFDAKVTKTKMTAGTTQNKSFADVLEKSEFKDEWFNASPERKSEIVNTLTDRMNADQVEVWTMDITPKMRESVIVEGQPMFARGDRPAKSGDIERVVAESFGKSTAKLLDAGQIRVVNKISELPGGPHPEDVKAMTDTDGTVYLVAKNIDPAEVRGLVLHEVGEHVGMERMLGPDLYQDLLRQFQDGIKRGDEAFIDAASRVPSDTPLKHVASEQLAYLI